MAGGAGAGPAAAAATVWKTIAARLWVAEQSFGDARQRVAASGQSAAHPGLIARLSRAIVWAQAAAKHAQALSAAYASAGTLYTTTCGEVGTAGEWRALKEALAEARIENAVTGGLAQARVDALQARLIAREMEKAAALTAYRNMGDTVGKPPASLPDPQLAPGAQLMGADIKPSPLSAPGDIWDPSTAYRLFNSLNECEFWILGRRVLYPGQKWECHVAGPGGVAGAFITNIA